ncbi:MAG: hypothetical protein ACLRWH_04875 [Emergencia sp.]|nr:hypothetical protein [Emergencia sp.]
MVTDKKEEVDEGFSIYIMDDCGQTKRDKEAIKMDNKNKQQKNSKKNSQKNANNEKNCDNTQKKEY